MPWTDGYSVQVKEIDAQHRKLIETINRFSLAGKSVGDSLQRSLIAILTEHAAVHFATEEKYMKAFNFEMYRSHCEEHESFVAQVNALKQRLEAGETVTAAEILGFLREWLHTHIMCTDKKYVACFKANGLV